MASRRALLAVRVLLGLTGADVLAIVVTGGWSVRGEADSIGFFLRTLTIAGLLAIHYRMTASARHVAGHVYVAALLPLLAIQYFLGAPMRGDGRWLYAITHSMAFDGDVRLNNQYLDLGLTEYRGAQPISETGMARSVYPVGAPILWLIFMPLGALGVWIRNIFGTPTAYDGYSFPYLNAVALGNLAFGWLGLLVLDRFLGRFFPRMIALGTTLTIAFGTFLLWYLGYQPLYTHPATFLFAALFFDRRMRTADSWRDFVWLGLFLGAATCVRWQSAVLGLLLAWDIFVHAWRGRRRLALTGVLASLASFSLAVVPQLFVWWRIFGRIVVGVPQGQSFMWWSRPFWTEVLFSSRHGLFSWSPVLIVAFIGLIPFSRRHSSSGLPLLGMLAVIYYVNSVISEWWAGGSFGGRRFDSALPILALGLAEALLWLRELLRRRPGIAVALVLGGVMVHNFMLAEQYRKNRIPPDDTVSWERVWIGMSEDVFDAVGYPFSIPANWLFALKYGRPKTQYDLVVGKYLFFLHNNMNGEIDLGPRDEPFVGNGWSEIRRWPRDRQGRLALAPKAQLLVPTHAAEDIRIEILCGITSASRQGAQRFEVRLNGRTLGVLTPPQDDLDWQKLIAPRDFWRRMNLLELVPADPTVEGPFLAVDRVRFHRF